MAPGLYLSEEEIEEFLNHLDKENSGYIKYDEVRNRLDEVYQEIAPELKPNHLHRRGREDEQRHSFLRSVIGTDEERISRANFANTLRSWNVPSLNPERQVKERHEDYLKRMSWGRRFRVYWSVQGREIMFIALVVLMQVAFGIWQMVDYLAQDKYRDAFGWGLIFSKACAGVLYPTLFFLILSMSRYLAAVGRKSYYLSKIVNWDVAQTFHIKISIVAMGFATLHGIGHLTGTFLYGGRRAQQPLVVAALGSKTPPRSYIQYISSLPGWTGITALGLFWVVTIISMPFVRKRNYELFQFGHLLMFPIIGLLMAHGASGLFQYPMLGFWLAFPTFLIIFERIVRIGYGLHYIPATLEIIDSDTVSVTINVPNLRYWEYHAGQYILLKIPQISHLQWHPFTISTYIENEVQVHIKTDGDWTSRIRRMAREGNVERIKVCIDGPFGAPAQRFYEFDQSIILGSGIGVTPFSGILNDLQAREDRRRNEGSPTPHTNTRRSGEKPARNYKPYRYRRVDFHWIVKDRNQLLWFSDLLNKVSQSANDHADDETRLLQVRLLTHVTQKRKDLSTHIYRYLLKLHRTEEHPESPFTGLLNATQFGRPDLGKIMNDHYEGLLRFHKMQEEIGIQTKKKVGVFFCGSMQIGLELADRCQLLTLRARQDKSNVEYHFMKEVFG